MKKVFQPFVWVLLPLMWLGSGCATNRGILDIRIAQLDNPESGKSVVIANVRDKRGFEEAPRDPAIPSLKGNEIDDKAITSRAIARKRNGYGKAIGDILLPEGRTVEDLVREALTYSFRQAGYRVIDIQADEKAPDGVLRVEADVEQFWAWFTPGFWTVSLEFEAKVKIKGQVEPFKKGELVRGYVKLHSQAAGTQAWSNTINKGLDAFIDEVRIRLAEK